MLAREKYSFVPFANIFPRLIFREPAVWLLTVLLATPRQLATPGFASRLANQKIKKGVARPGEVCQIFREYKTVKGA
jgi:hypothetical protein